MANLGSVGFTSCNLSTNIVTPIVFFKTSFYGHSVNVTNPLTKRLYFPKITSIGEQIEGDTKSIKGITKKDAIPASKIVRLYDRISGQLVIELLSEPDGSFEFNNLSVDHEFYIVVLDNDPGSIYNAEISDHLFAIVG